MGQVAGGDNVWDGISGKTADLAALGQMKFNEIALFAAQLDEGVERFDHAGALGPAAARATGQGNDGHGAFGQGIHAQIMQRAGHTFSGICNISRLHIFNLCC